MIFVPGGVQDRGTQFSLILKECNMRKRVSLPPPHRRRRRRPPPHRRRRPPPPIQWPFIYQELKCP